MSVSRPHVAAWVNVESDLAKHYSLTFLDQPLAHGTLALTGEYPHVDVHVLDHVSGQHRTKRRRRSKRRDHSSLCGQLSLDG